MKKLNLDAFKAKVEATEKNNIDNLIGGILGACHCTVTQSGGVTYINCD